MKKAKIILCTLLALVMIFSLFACGKTNDAGSDGSVKPASDGNKPSTITVGTSSALGRFLDGLSPTQNIGACSVVYDLLFLIDSDTKQPYSKILSDWEYTDDLTFVMTLRPDITFRNGEVATADDLLFSIMQHYERGTTLIRKLGPIDIDNCTSDGEYSVTLKFTSPYGPGIYGNLLYLFDKSWSEEAGWDSEDWYSNPNGSGPYKVTEYVADDHITVALKDNYWNAANETFDVQEWIFKYYPDASTLYMALEKGDVALCDVSNIADYERWKSQGSEGVGMKICSMGGNNNFMISPTNNPVFNDINVREALAYGVDWVAMGKLAMGDLYEQATSIIVPGSPYYLDVGAYQYDPDRAKQVLADAGYKNGDIKINIYTMSTDMYKNVSEALQFYCQDLGIDVDLKFGDVTSALSVWMEDGGSDVGWYTYVYGTLDGEPNSTLQPYYIKSFTWGLGNDQEVIDKFLQALYTIDTDKRTQLYHEIQQTVHDKYLIFPVYVDVAAVGYRNDIFSEAEINQYVYNGSNINVCGLSQAD